MVIGFRYACGYEYTGALRTYNRKIPARKSPAQAIFNAFGGVPLAPIPFLPNIRLPAHHQAHTNRANRPTPAALMTIEPRNSRG